MKKYELIVSSQFPSKHPRKGDKTYFDEQILFACGKISQVRMQEEWGDLDMRKLHTVRKNVPYWKKIVEEVQQGKATLTVKTWIGRPYWSKKLDILTFDHTSPIGYEIMDIRNEKSWVISPDELSSAFIDLNIIAHNDGLCKDDFIHWIAPALNEQFIIIHFTEFRYSDLPF